MNYNFFFCTARRPLFLITVTIELPHANFYLLSILVLQLLTDKNWPVRLNDRLTLSDQFSHTSLNFCKQLSAY